MHTFILLSNGQSTSFNNTTPLQKILFLFIIALILFLFFISNKNSKGKIYLKNENQVTMVKEYEQLVDEYNELIESLNLTIDEIKSDNTIIKTEDDFVFIKKKLDDFYTVNARIVALIEGMPNQIDKNKKQGFNTSKKDVKIYMQKIKNTVIEINTVASNGQNDEMEGDKIDE